jgi:PleD family two-component response regulator
MQSIRQKKWSFNGAPLDVNVSVGVANFAEGNSTSDLVRLADQALLEAKRMGKNRIILHESGGKEQFTAIETDDFQAPP